MSNLNPNLARSAAAGAARWSDERVEKLKTLAAEGYSASIRKPSGDDLIRAFRKVA